jgi:hypothetical protein
MSISQLVAAIDSAAKATSPSTVQMHMRTIRTGVKQIGDRLAAIEKRLDALERET